MKILIIQENGRHNENRIFRECFNFQRAFQRIGIDAIVWGLGHDNFTTPFDEIIKGIDVVFLIENYEVGGWIPDMSNLNIFKIFWSIDSHCTLWNHVNTAKKHKVDLVLNAIESHQVHFDGLNTYYIPNAYPSDLIKHLDYIEKNAFIGFCGTNFDERIQYIDRLSSRFKISISKDIWWLGNSMVEKINTYQIHFNKTVSNDINYRVFETMGCNTVSLTNNTENITRFFTDMEDIVIYQDENDLYDKVDFLIKNPEEVKKISQRGYDHVTKNHTYDNRAQEILQIINSYI
jgi:hypothetical protein